MFDYDKELKAVDDKIDALREELTQLNTLKKGILKRTPFLCGGCNETQEIGNTTYIQRHWYESPWGCTGGDTWHREKWGVIVCPSCKSKLSLYNNETINSLKDHFKEVIDEYDRK